jgi:glutamate dehydrogenase
VPDQPATERYLVDYFPHQAIEAAGVRRLREHRLRREIISTQMVSDLVDLMGASFLHRVARDTGRSVDEVVSAWYIASQIAGAPEIRMELDRLDGQYPSETIYRWLFGLARVLERTTGWVLSNVNPDASTEVAIREMMDGLGRLRSEFRGLVSGEDRVLFEQRLTELSELGVAEGLAERLITLRFLPELLDILRIAQGGGKEPISTAQSYYLVADHFGVGWLQQLLRGAVLEEVWEKRLTQTLLSDLQRAHRKITRRLLEAEQPGSEMHSRLAAFEDGRAREVEQYRGLLEELRTAEHPSLAGCAVAVRALTDLSEP